MYRDPETDRSGGGGPPLGNTTESVVTPAGEASTGAERRSSRALLYRLQRHSGRLLWRARRDAERRGDDTLAARLTDRVSMCRNQAGKGPGGMVREAEIWGRTTECGVTARYVGAAVCANPWACPVCADAIARRRREELAAADLALEGQGYARYMLTFTQRHSSADSLDSLIRRSAKALQKWRQRRGVRRVLESAGFKGQVRATEVLHGASGWHPHYHSYFVFDRALTGAEVEALRREWVAILRSEGGDGVDAVALDVREVYRGQGGQCSIGDYLSKIGNAASVSYELSGGGNKDRAKGRTPAMLLLDSLGGDRRSGARFVEYVAAMRGRAQLYWSPGLRALVAEHLDERSDEELAAEPVEEGADECLSVLPGGALWVISQVGVRAQTLDVAERDPPAVGDWYEAVRAAQLRRQRMVRREEET